MSFRNLKRTNFSGTMKETHRTENKKSTPAPNEKEDVKNIANQSTEKKAGGGMGIIAIIIILAIIIFGIIWFT